MFFIVWFVTYVNAIAKCSSYNVVCYVRECNSETFVILWFVTYVKAVATYSLYNVVCYVHDCYGDVVV